MVDINGECTSSFNDKQRWMEGLNQNENYWEGVVSDVDQVLWRHGLEMVTSYGTNGCHYDCVVDGNSQIPLQPPDLSKRDICVV